MKTNFKEKINSTKKILSFKKIKFCFLKKIKSYLAVAEPRVQLRVLEKFKFIKFKLIYLKKKI